MLVLSRKEGESIIIAGEITVTVVNVGQGRVKIGIDAPSHVKIDRAEIHDRIVDAFALDLQQSSSDTSITGPGTMPPVRHVNRLPATDSSSKGKDIRKHPKPR